jgi:beta-phosphoglucomutase
MIKGILFDLDGVLVDTTQLQIDSTIKALSPFVKKNNHIISILKQTITTKEKLQIFCDANYLKKNQLETIYINKKKIFKKEIKKRKIFSKIIYNIFIYLKKKNYKCALVTNANLKTTLFILKKMKINKFFSVIVTNENRIKPKPNPEPYVYAIKKLCLKKENCLIFEDSEVGLLSAKRSGAKTIKVNNVKDLNKKYLISKINKYETI